MIDQATALRKKLASMNNEQEQPKTIAVISGKGGVGKSNLSLNFSIALSRFGKKVLLFDMDIGMGNIDILMGITAHHSIVDLFEKNLTMKELLIKGPEGIDYIAGGNGLPNMFKLDEDKSEYLIEQLQFILNDYDYVIFDMGAGMTEENVKFLLAMDEIFVITTSEPTAITDAYSAMKYICLFDQFIPLYLIVNRAENESEGMQTLKRLKQVVLQFLVKEVNLLGVLLDDKAVQKAVSRQEPFLLYAPKALISKNLLDICKKYLDENNEQSKEKNQDTSFISKLQRFFVRGR
ncbi:MinD/ParA family protein [Fredinandcohnia sp. QZ13]|uniref:MinD/ParA family protein n=1 Tax=Fredinandcohnia sp. QZ13 TaxID=3073144 RepID=UPI0028534439|nr:MinD/ParA family protein [Fredinandcohnia sp. QZ13]MDR4886480.1 MinD/ParA family protein [Fredinandcohnia sp. QZ13]